MMREGCAKNCITAWISRLSWPPWRAQNAGRGREKCISKQTLDQEKGQKRERGRPGALWDGLDFQAKVTPLEGPKCERGAPK